MYRCTFKTHCFSWYQNHSLQLHEKTFPHVEIKPETIVVSTVTKLVIG